MSSNNNRPKRAVNKGQLHDWLKNYFDQQLPVSDKLFGNRPRQGQASVDELVQMGIHAAELEQEYGVDNAVWARQSPSGQVEVAFSPVCPPGFRDLEEVIMEAARTDPKVAAYLDNAQRVIDIMAAEEGLPKPPPLLSRKKRQGFTND